MCDRGSCQEHLGISYWQVASNEPRKNQPSWIERMERAGLKRSMSRKGCSPDNVAGEGLYGYLKNELFYYHKWTRVSLSEFVDTLNEYLVWYNAKKD